MTSDHVIYLFVNLAKGGYIGTGKISDSEGGWGRDLKGSNQFCYEIYYKTDIYSLISELL